MAVVLTNRRTFLIGILLFLLATDVLPASTPKDAGENILPDWNFKYLSELLHTNRITVLRMAKSMTALLQQRQVPECGQDMPESLETLNRIVSKFVQEMNMTIAVLKNSSTMIQDELEQDSQHPWSCKSEGQCIPVHQRCDGVDHCNDGSDETPAVCSGLCGGDGMFRCASRTCVSISARCDGSFQCLSGSDEDNCQTSCTYNQFLCMLDHACIPIGWRCDNVKDCSDNSDEFMTMCGHPDDPSMGRTANSSLTAQSPPASTPRTNTTTLPKPAPPRASEPDDTCTSANDRFRCTEGNLCLMSCSRCDDVEQCPDGSDEIGCDHPQMRRRHKRFPCEIDHSCLPLSWVCDRVYDCSDGSDEKNCDSNSHRTTPAPVTYPPVILTTLVDPSPRFALTCSPQAFRCNRGGRCIPKSWVCDGENDCPGSSDEFYCDEESTTQSHVCTGNKIKCAGEAKCIERSWLCDGIVDCRDGEDENDCGGGLMVMSLTTQRIQPVDPSSRLTTSMSTMSQPAFMPFPLQLPTTQQPPPPPATPPPATPPPPPATPTDTQQIRPLRCKSFEMACRDGSGCIWSVMRCDGLQDCLDGSDEHNCLGTCSRSEFPCGSGDCVPWRKRCDGDKNCADGSDEKHCGQYHEDQPPEPAFQPLPPQLPPTTTTTTTTPVPIGPRLASPAGAPCVPELGYFRCEDGGACLPASLVCNNVTDCSDGSDEGNDCTLQCPNTCIYGCYKTPAGHQCLCPSTKYYLDDQDTCKVGPPPGFLLVTVGRDIFAITHDGSRNYSVLTNSDVDLRGVSYDPKDEVVYWVAGVSGLVYSKPLRQDVASLISTNDLQSWFEDVAVDYVGRNLYLTDTKNKRISVCKMKTNYCHTLLPTDHTPRAIQLDFYKGMVYWSTAGPMATIHRAGMDGSDSPFSLQFSRPSAFTFDSRHRNLHWYDNNSKIMERLKDDGDSYSRSGPLVASVYDMAVWQDHLFWTDDLHRKVMTCTVDNCEDDIRVLPALTTITQTSWIHHYSPDNFGFRNKLWNPCQFDFCSHLCLLSPESQFSYVCSCPDNLTLKNDNVSCGNSSVPTPYGYLQGHV